MTRCGPVRPGAVNSHAPLHQELVAAGSLIQCDKCTQQNIKQKKTVEKTHSTVCTTQDFIEIHSTV